MWPFVAPAPEAEAGLGTVPTFSVVIAAYQAAETVAVAVRSALEQTVPPHEVIVVDDGSTDGTAEVIVPFADRVTVITQQNRGSAAAKNVGVRAATGEFFVILDADDSFLPQRLEALGAFGAARPDLDILMTDAYLEVGGRPVARFCRETPFAVDDQRVAIFDRCFLIAPAVRRERFLEIGGFDEAIPSGFDWDCWIRLLLGGARAGLVEAPLYVYRLVTGSLSDDRPRTLWGRVAVLEKGLGNPELRREERSALRRALQRHRQRALLTEAEAALRSGAADARRRALAVALGSGFGLRTRTKALLAALAPRAAGRRLEIREASTGRSRLERSYPR
jgi:glycosyltransferase involved in cell wall biosynthesis